MTIIKNNFEIDVLFFQVFSQKKRLTNFPGLGLGYIAAFLKKNNVKVGIFNSLKYYQNKEIDNKLIWFISKYKPKVIGISSTAYTLLELIRVSKLIKKRFKNVLLVVGGYGPTFYPEIINKAPIDICVLGEGECSFFEVIKNYIFLNRKNFSQILGVISKPKDIKQKQPQFIDDLDSIPFPEREYLDGTVYAKNILLTSRGCIYNCKFCAVNKFYKNCIPKRRIRKTEEVTKEIIYLKKKYPEIDYIEFFDDEFLIDGQRATEIFNQIRNSKSLKGLKFTFAARSNDIVQNEKFITKNKDLIKEVFCGIESFNPDFLEKLGKYVNGEIGVNFNIKAINLLEKNQIPAKYGFINPPYPPSVDYLRKHLPYYYKNNFISLQNLLFNIGNYINYEIPYNAVEGKFKVKKNKIYERYENVMTYFENNLRQPLSQLHKRDVDLSEEFLRFFDNALKYTETGKINHYKASINSFTSKLNKK